MSDNQDKIESEIVYIRPGCYRCGKGKEVPYLINVSSVKSDNDRWIVKGKGHLVHRRCNWCAWMYEAIMYTIPIECSPFPCPKCSELQNLKYELTSITTEKETFEFEVIIECSKCRKKNSLSKVLKKIIDIIKLEVSPTGITIKKS